MNSSIQNIIVNKFYLKTTITAYGRPHFHFCGRGHLSGDLKWRQAEMSTIKMHVALQSPVSPRKQQKQGKIITIL